MTEDQIQAEKTFILMNNIMLKAIAQIWDQFRRAKDVKIHILMTIDDTPGCYFSSNDRSGGVHDVMKKVIGKMNEQLNEKNSFTEVRNPRGPK